MDETINHGDFVYFTFGINGTGVSISESFGVSVNIGSFGMGKPIYYRTGALQTIRLTKEQIDKLPETVKSQYDKRLDSWDL